MHGLKLIEPQQIEPARFLCGRALAASRARRSRRRNCDCDSGSKPAAGRSRAMSSSERPSSRQSRMATSRRARSREGAMAAGGRRGMGIGVGWEDASNENARRPTRPRAQLSTLPDLYHSSPRPSSAKNAKSIKIRPAAIIRRRAAPWTSREAALIPIPSPARRGRREQPP